MENHVALPVADERSVPQQLPRWIKQYGNWCAVDSDGTNISIREVFGPDFKWLWVVAWTNASDGSVNISINSFKSLEEAKKHVENTIWVGAM